MADNLIQHRKSYTQDSCIIRQADLRDLYSVINCIEASFEPFISVLGQIPSALNADFKQIISNNNLYVAIIDDKVVGTIEIIMDNENVKIEKLSVLPDFRGNKIGNKLICYAEFLAKANKLSKVKLFTNELLDYNIKYFRNSGFIETERKTENGFKRVYFEKIIIE